jgi:hypothetical protein
MPWFKVDDGFYTSQKFLNIPRQYQAQAAGLWMLAGVYSADKLTDGYVSYGVLKLWEYDEEVFKWLVEVGLWREHESGRGITFHDWNEYQPTREQYEERRESLSKKRSDAAKKRWDSVEPDANMQNVCKTDANDMQTVCPEPEPEPEPNIAEVNILVAKKTLPATKGTRFSVEATLEPSWLDWCLQNRPDLDPQQTFEAFKDYWISATGRNATKLDWEATWRNWCRNQRKQSTAFVNQKRTAQMEAQEKFLKSFETVDTVVVNAIEWGN